MSNKKIFYFAPGLTNAPIAKHPDGAGRGVLALLARDIEAKAPYST
jgi:hypothetical protein